MERIRRIAAFVPPVALALWPQAAPAQWQVVSLHPSGADTVLNCCRGDFNGNGSASVQDIFDFLVAYFAGCP